MNKICQVDLKLFEISDPQHSRCYVTFNGSFNLRVFQGPSEAERRRREEEQARLDAMPEWKRNLIIAKKN